MFQSLWALPDENLSLMSSQGTCKGQVAVLMSARKQWNTAEGFVSVFLALCRTQNCDTWEFKEKVCKFPAG